MEDENIEYVSKKTSQIDFIDALNHILERKAKIYKFMIIFLILGVVIAFITPKEYTSSSIILPQISSNKGLSKKYSNIASLVGINLGQSEGNKIVPTLYPIIVEGAPFQKAILQKKINIEELEDSVTLFDYLQNYKKDGLLNIIKGYTVGLPSKIINSLKSDDNGEISKILDRTLYQYSKEEELYITYLKEHLNISFNENDGYINITATMDEPVAAAQLVRNAQNLLQDFIIDYNIKKSNDELIFIEERLEVAKEEYSDKRARLGDFRDRNKNGILSTTKNREEQLKSEYDLAYNMYSELSSQRESAKLQVEKDTPIFTELQPALITSEPSAPNKIKIVFGSIVIGMLLAIAIILLKFLSPVFLDYLNKSED
jgi:capsule polysaccharide export protein KpsE/RkpR